MKYLLPLFLALLFVSPRLEAQTPIDAAAVKAAKGVTYWECNTFGGWVGDAIRIARELRAQHAVTSAPAGAVCASAGALVWLAGSRRQLGGRLLFHGIKPEPDPQMKFELFMMIVSWDVPQFAAAKIVFLKPGEVWEPEGSDLVALLR